MTATTYIVVSDRFSSDPVETTLLQFFRDCEELGWKPNLIRSEDNYIDAETGEVVLQKK